MKNTIKQIFHSGKFVTGFVIFLAILLTIIIYPLVVAKDPLAMIGNGNFFKPRSEEHTSELQSPS